MNNIRVTTLEIYRKSIETEYVSEEDVVKAITSGQFINKPSDSKIVNAGTAWHKLMEKPYVESSMDYLINTGMGKFNSVEVDMGRKHLGPGAKEIRSYVDLSNSRLWGTADHIRGNCVRDIKCKFSNLDVVDYEPSLQWRSYLLIFDCSQFIYDFFTFSEVEDNTYALKSIDSVTFWRYLDIAEEVNSYAKDFLEFCKRKKIDHLLNYGP